MANVQFVLSQKAMAYSTQHPIAQLAEARLVQLAAKRVAHSQLEELVAVAAHHRVHASLEIEYVGARVAVVPAAHRVVPHA